MVGQRKLYDTPDSPTADIVKERLPERYTGGQTMSPIFVEIKNGANEFNFDLTSKERASP